MFKRWLYSGLFAINVCAWTPLASRAWEQHQERQRQMDVMETLRQNVRYWTAQSECDTRFGYGTLNSDACQDRVAVQHGRVAEWEKEKVKFRARVDEIIREADGLEKGITL